MYLADPVFLGLLEVQIIQDINQEIQCHLVYWKLVYESADMSRGLLLNNGTRGKSVQIFWDGRNVVIFGHRWGVLFLGN